MNFVFVFCNIFLQHIFPKYRLVELRCWGKSLNLWWNRFPGVLFIKLYILYGITYFTHYFFYGAYYGRLFGDGAKAVHA